MTDGKVEVELVGGPYDGQRVRVDPNAVGTWMGPDEACYRATLYSDSPPELFRLVRPSKYVRTGRRTADGMPVFRHASVG